MIPEPFSITTGVLGIIGFLNLARQGAEALHKDVKAYHRVADHVHGFSRDMESAQWRLDNWRSMWLIGPETHADLPVFSWGIGGWKTIRHQIEKIESISKAVDKVVSPLSRQHIPQAIAQDPQALRDIQNLSSEAIRGKTLRSDEIERIESNIKWGEKLAFALTSKAEDLDELFSKYDQLFNQLYLDCDNAYFHQHRDQTRDISEQEHHDTAMSQMLIQHALRTRDASQALHRCCSVGGEDGYELDLSLLRWKVGQNEPRPLHAGIPQKLCYYLTIPSTTLSSIIHTPHANGPNMPQTDLTPLPQLELLIEPTTKSSENNAESFKNVCLALTKGRFCYLRDNSEGEGGRYSFKFSRPSKPLGDSGFQRDILLNLIASSARSAHANDLSFRERIEVAYSIAECALLLLGTSWLSNLCESTVLRLHGEGQETRYRILVGSEMLEVPGPNDLQTRQIGHLLRQLAYGTDDTTEYDSKKDLTKIAEEIDVAYASAIEFCYKPPLPTSPLQTPKDYDTYYRRILTQYCKKVFLPYHNANTSLLDQLPQDAQNQPEGPPVLLFSKVTYEHSTALPIEGLIPTLASSPDRPDTLLNTLRSTLRAMSVRSKSTLGGLGKSSVIVYYTQTADFKKLSRDDVPDRAHRILLPGHGMTYKINMPVRDSTKSRELATLRFEELGKRVVWKRAIGKIQELYIVDDVFGEIGAWDLVEDTDED